MNKGWKRRGGAGGADQMSIADEISSNTEASGYSASSHNAPAKVRSVFPETWLWTDSVIRYYTFCRCLKIVISLIQLAATLL